MKESQHDKMHSHNIDELFRSAIDPYEEAPSLEIWESVEKDLDRYGIVHIKKKYDNLKKVAIALVLLLSSTVLYEIQTRHTNDGKNETANKLADKSHSKHTIADIWKNIKKEKVDMNKTDAAAVTVDKKINLANTLEITISDANKSLQAGDAKKTFNNFRDRIAPGGPAISSITVIERVPSLDKATFIKSALPPVQQFYEPIAVKDPGLSLAKSAMPAKSTISSSQAIQLTEGRKRSKFSLSLVFSPDFTSRRVKEDWPINREDNKDEIRKSERYAFSYSFGALTDYRINDHWSIESGLLLSRAVINIDPKFIFARPDFLGDMKYKFNSSSGYSFLMTKSASRPAFGDSLHAFRSTSSLQYVSVPLAMKYKVGKKKFAVYGVAGAEANILVKDKIETSLGGNHENAVNKDIRGLKPVYYSAMLAAGAEYNINKTLAFNFTPTARFALTSINKDVPVKSYQHSLGLVAGVQVSF